MGCVLFLKHRFFFNPLKMGKRYGQTFQRREYMDGKYTQDVHVISGQKFKLNLQWNHFTPITTLKMKDCDNIEFWRGCRETRSLIHCWQESKNGTTTLGNGLAVYFKTKHAVAIQLRISLLDIYPKEMNRYIHIKPVHKCAESFIHSRPKLHTGQMSFDRWIIKLRYISIQYHEVSVHKKKPRIHVSLIYLPGIMRALKSHSKRLQTVQFHIVYTHTHTFF